MQLLDKVGVFVFCLTHKPTNHTKHKTTPLQINSYAYRIKVMP